MPALPSPGVSRKPPHSPHASISTMPLPVEPRSRRSASISDFPPPIRRVSSEHTRPVSFSAKFSRVHPATTGVTVLEHMERLDAVEAGLKRLGVEDDDEIDDDEVDVGMVRPKGKKKATDNSGSPAQPLLSPSALSERLPAVLEDSDDVGQATDVDNESLAEEDLVAMSKSMPHLEASPTTSRWMSPTERPNLDWMDIDSATSPKRRAVIAEVGTLSFYYCSIH